MPRLAVLGHPVSHSRSPAMQTAALAELGLAASWSYEAIEVAPEGFEPLVRSLPDDGFAGVNVTVPHKLAALALADRASAAAREIGAANTLSFDRGRVHADNTDAAGIVNAIGEPAGGPPGARARRRRIGARGDLGPARGRRRGLGLEPDRGEGGRPSRRSSGLRVAGPDATGFDLLVNATTVGLGRQASARRRPPT